jgi:hypothetical protein
LHRCQRSSQTGYSGSVSSSGAVIDIVGADPRAHKFLHDIVVFVGATSGRKAGDGIAAVFALDFAELVATRSRASSQEDSTKLRFS